MEETHSSTSNSKSHQGPRALVLKLLFTLPLFIIVAAVNFFEDPANLYHAHIFEKNLSEILLSGKNIGNVTNFDDRLVNKYFIERVPGPVDTLVLCTSRCMGIGERTFKGRGIINNSVSSASLEDFLGLFYGYVKRGVFPKRVILGLEYWMLNRHIQPSRWKSISEDTLAMVNLLGMKPSDIGVPMVSLDFERWFNLVSPSYFQTSIEKVIADRRRSVQNLPEFFPTTSTKEDYLILLSDGSRSFGKEYLGRSVETVNEIAVEAGITAVHPYMEMDKGLQQVLEKFIVFMKAKNIEVTIFLPPYHWETYQRFTQRKDMKMFFRVNEWYRELAAQHGLSVVGSSDPSPLNLTREEFIDDLHVKESGMQKIFARFFQNKKAGIDSSDVDRE